MIKHIVLLKFKSIFSDPEVDAALNQFNHLRAVIPGIKNFSFGKNCSPEGLSRGFTHVFSMSFDDAQARDFYLEHPEHQRVAMTVMLPMLENGLESVLAIDYVFD